VSHKSEKFYHDDRGSKFGNLHDSTLQSTTPVNNTPLCGEAGIPYENDTNDSHGSIIAYIILHLG